MNHESGGSMELDQGLIERLGFFLSEINLSLGLGISTSSHAKRTLNFFSTRTYAVGSCYWLFSIPI